MSLRLLTLFSFAILITACEHDAVEPEVVKKEEQKQGCDTSKIYYQNEIQPIFTSNCAFSGCHDAGTATKGVILTTYDRVIQSDVIKAGDPDDSELFERITETDVNKRMPFFRNPLSSEQINKIRKWIAQGAKNTVCESTFCDTTSVTFSSTILPLISNKCQGCHSGGSPGGGILLTDYSKISIVAKDLRLLNAILHTPGFKAMPLGGDQLPPCDIEKVRIWINAGSPNN